jgi:hypothetical protein
VFYSRELGYEWGGGKGATTFKEGPTSLIYPRVVSRGVTSVQITAYEKTALRLCELKNVIVFEYFVTKIGILKYSIRILSIRGINWYLNIYKCNYLVFEYIFEY